MEAISMGGQANALALLLFAACIFQDKIGLTLHYNLFYYEVYSHFTIVLPFCL